MINGVGIIYFRNRLLNRGILINSYPLPREPHARSENTCFSNMRLPTAYQLSQASHIVHSVDDGSAKLQEHKFRMWNGRHKTLMTRFWFEIHIFDPCKMTWCALASSKRNFKQLQSSGEQLLHSSSSRITLLIFQWVNLMVNPLLPKWICVHWTREH